MKKLPKIKLNSAIVIWLGGVVAISLGSPALAAETANFRVIVNSNQDGAIAPDSNLTLREAIAFVNGDLSLASLSPTEQAQIKSIDSNLSSRIEFNLPPEQNTIHLVNILPPLTNAGLIIDGTTQPGYRKNSSKYLQISQPIVEITPAENVEIFRGLSVAADNITIRGLSIYGFTSQHRSTASTPPADIFVADRKTLLLSENIANSKSKQSTIPPKNVVIENNWLGISPTANNSSNSAFGVSVFNGLGTIIKHNRIANHDGSGIITALQAANLVITHNILENNGMAGMPDAIRLEGIINNSRIDFNLIKNNAGSAIYTFKPEGSVVIKNNNIKNNGLKLRKAAIYLMGNDHTVINNKITQQLGSGVVIAAYPQSRRNRIQGNQFFQLEGLSIDLITQRNIGVQDYQQGDGVNPPTDSYQRRRKTGNFGIDAPQFLSREFFIVNPNIGVTIDGKAEAGSVVEIYRVVENNASQGPLNQSIATVQVNQKGRFSATLADLKPGDKVSAIATHPEYGTSEPAVNAVIRSIEGQR